MKWLSGGLTFVNVTTVCGLLFGIAADGLGNGAAFLSIVLGGLAGMVAYLTTESPNIATTKPEAKTQRSRRRQQESTAPQKPRSYQNIWLWLVGSCFAIFAFRSFCWLLYIDGGQLKIQSPNNLGDIAIHLTYINNFASGVPLWPENPILTQTSLRYPAGIDLFNALLACLGVDVRQALIWVGLLGSLATFYAFWRWSGVFGIAGFLFNGGTAGLEILQTWKWSDYQGVGSIAWKSIPLAMLVTQRGLLYAIPAGLLLLYHWRAKFFSEYQGEALSKAPSAHRVGGSETAAPWKRGPLPFWVECSLYATMPLFHVHTFMALSIALGVWFLIGNWERKKQLLLLAGCAFLPATFFASLISNHFQAGSVFSWQPGWVQTVGDFAKPFFTFWWVNFGLWLPLMILWGALSLWTVWQSKTRSIFNLPTGLAFLIPASAIFILACFVKTATWEWDNTKVIIWAYFMVLPFLWRELIARWPEPVQIAVCVALFSSGFVSLIGGLAAGQPGFGFADRAELDAVGVAVRRMPTEARFAAFPIYSHPLLLNGRKVVAGYEGHLMSQGFDYGATITKLKSLMIGAPDWKETARDLEARYLFWGREENLNYPTSERPWEQTAKAVATGAWGTIYDLEANDGAISGSR